MLTDVIITLSCPIKKPLAAFICLLIMNTHSITKEQLDKLVEAIDSQFESYFQNQDSEVSSLRDCFYKPDMYEEQGLYALKDDALKDFPDKIRQKTHEMIATISSVD